MRPSEIAKDFYPAPNPCKDCACEPVCGESIYCPNECENFSPKVVRCKDCKYYHQYHVGKTNELCEWGKCKLISMDVDMPANGYCCYGERIEDGETEN